MATAVIINFGAWLLYTHYTTDRFKMKICLFILFFMIFLTDAVEVNDEDTNSPLVSYLLAKVQRLEAKVMTKPNVRNTREVEKRSVDTNTSADDKNTKDCPQQLVTYIRWGNTTCPYGANTIYKGTAVGGRHDHETSPSNLMCLPFDTMNNPNSVGGSTTAYDVEYRVGGILRHVDCRTMTCALCEATGRGDKIMIPSHYVCPDGWHKEYSGYIMAGHYSHHGGSMYYCIDENVEPVKGSGSCGSAHLLYPVSVSRRYVSTTGNVLFCVVCTK